MTTTLNPHHDDLAAALTLHHRPTGEIVEALDTLTLGLPEAQWPAGTWRLLWALHLPATTTTTTEAEE